MGDLIVVCYHATSPAWSSELSVMPERLERQIEMMLRRGYCGVTFSEAVTSPTRGKMMAITFDDGYRSTFDVAFPILQRFGIPATLFVPTAFVGLETPMSWPGIDHWADSTDGDDLRCVNWDQVGQLAAAGWEIGSHSRTHPLLTTLTDEGLDHELAVSREECEAGSSSPCRAIAYPYGDVDVRVIEAARTAGYLNGAGLPIHPCPAYPLDWPRVGIYRSDDKRRHQLKVSPLMRQLRMRLGPGVSRDRKRR